MRQGDNNPRSDIKKGDRFGQRVVLDPHPEQLDANWTVLVQCNCGAVDQIRATRLKQRNADRCPSCARIKKIQQTNTDRLQGITPGDTFGWLTVISDVATKSNSHPAKIQVQCMCGLTDQASIKDLVNGKKLMCRKCEAEGPQRFETLRWLRKTWEAAKEKLNAELPDQQALIDVIERTLAPTEGGQQRRSTYQGKRGKWRVGNVCGSLHRVCKAWGILDSSVVNLEKPKHCRNPRPGIPRKQALETILARKYGSAAPDVVEIEPDGRIIDTCVP